MKKHICELLHDPNFFYDDIVYEYNIPELLTTMFEYIHIMYYKKPYDYMFHWANKCGGWVETNWYDDYLKRRIDENENK